MQSAQHSLLTDLIADLIADRSIPLSEEWATIGERAFIDTVGVTLAGSEEEPVRILGASCETTGGAVFSLASSTSMTVRDVALLDGTSAHALDLDDMDEAYIAHPSAVLLPALWSVGQSIDATGEQILSAFRVGAITNRLIAAHLDITAHFVAGWHPTSTIGTVGAAAAVSHLLRASSYEARNALGVAGSLAAGSRQNFGTMAKPLHAGFAASNGVLAAQLACRGFTANAEQLTGAIGFLKLFGATADRPTPSVETISGMFDPVGFNIKRYPCCYRTHPAIEAALELADRVKSEEVKSVTVTVQTAGLAPLIHHRPVDGTEAKFSMEYAVAAALLDGDVTFRSFDDSRAIRPRVQDLLRRVSLSESAVPPTGPSHWTESFAVVTVTTIDGRTLTARSDVARGHVTKPLTEKELRAKFSHCVGFQDHGVSDSAYNPLRSLRSARSICATMKLVHQLKTRNSKGKPC